MRTALPVVLLLLLTPMVTSAQWELVNAGLPFSSTIQYFGTSPGSMLVFLTSTGNPQAAVFRTTDEGLTWVKADSGLTLPTQSPTGFAQLGNRTYASTGGFGLFVTTDGGNFWSKMPIPPSNLANFGYTLAVRDSVLYVGHYGISYSTDFGSTWAREKSGLTGSIVVRIAYDGGNSLYLASDGIYKSTNNGDDWVSVNGQIGTVNTYDVLPVGGYVFAGTSDKGVFRSTDGGANWTAVNTGLESTLLDAWTLAWGGGFLFVSTTSGVFVSSDYGDHWTYADAGSPVAPDQMFVHGNYIFTNDAFGLSRHVVTDFLPATSVMLPLSATGLLNFNNAQAATGVSVNVTSLTGAANVTVNRFATPPVNTAFSATPPASTSQFRWVINVQGNPTLSGEIRIKPSAFGVTITDPASVTIYKRPTSGAGTFVALPTTYDNATGEFVATITGFSEFILGSTGQLTDAPKAVAAMPAEFRLEQNYPNPFNPSTNIAYTVGGIRHQVSGISNVRLSVYDILGREVAVLVNENKMPGAYKVRFDASGLSSGVYFYRLEAGTFVQTRKLVLLR